eukprot:365698-Chlamydomonas_euryale.AAC.15
MHRADTLHPCAGQAQRTHAQGRHTTPMHRACTPYPCTGLAQYFTTSTICFHAGHPQCQPALSQGHGHHARPHARRPGPRHRDHVAARSHDHQRAGGELCMSASSAGARLDPKPPEPQSS